MRRLLRGLGWTLIGMGSFVLYFLVYQLVGTNAVTSKDQAALRGQLERDWSATRPATPRDPTRAPPRAVPLGEGLAVLEIPKIQLQRVIVEGVARDGSRSGRVPRPLTEAELRARIDALLAA